MYHPKLFKLISLKKIFDKNDHHIEQIYNDYYMRLNNSTIIEERLGKEKESLCYHIEYENSRIEKSDNKVNVYATIVLTLLPILLGISFDSILLLLKINLIYKAIFIISAYFAMNIVLYLFQYIKVGKYNMSRFSTLKEEQDENLTQRLVSQYYYDYQSLKNKANFFVSYVLNIQKWMEASLTLFIIAFSYHQIYMHFSNAPKRVDTSNSIIYNMDVATLNDPYSKDSIQLTNIKKCVQMQDADMMIVIYNDQSDIGIIKSEFLIFDSSFEIQYVNDNQLEPDDIKILVYKKEYS